MQVIENQVRLRKGLHQNVDQPIALTGGSN
jgi:hypothetical protein